MRRLLRRQERGVEPLATPRLELIAMTPKLLAAEEEGPQALGEALRAAVPQDWPPKLWEMPVRAHIVAQLTTEPGTVGWHRYMLLRSESGPLLVGSLGAFPCAAGDVELGYSVVDSWQRRGLATEAVQGLMAWLFQQNAVRSVSAQAYESAPASVKVMQRCGMRFLGPGDEPATVRYRSWRS